MKFTGQQKLIDSLNKSNSRTMLIYGPKHHGKKTLIRQFYADKGMSVYEVTGNAADFRESIEMMRTQTNPTVYLIPDVDMLNVTVQNLLLKVLEEPPMKAIFVLTASNRILPTIKSRCVTYMTEPYTKDEIIAVHVDNENCLDYADSPGRCELIRQAVEFKESVVSGPLVSLMEQVDAIMTTPDSIAQVLCKVNDISKLLKDKNISYFTFWLLARKIYENSAGITLLSEHLSELDRYLMINFYMLYWRERVMSR